MQPTNQYPGYSRQAGLAIGQPPIQQPAQKTTTLDDEDIWLTSALRYGGYADEIGESLDNFDPFKEKLQKGLARFFGAEKAEKWANKTYNIPMFCKDRSLTPFLGYAVSLVYCVMDGISRSFQGWKKARQGGFSKKESSLKVGADLIGLGIFHFFATMKLAPGLLQLVGNFIRNRVTTEDAKALFEANKKKGIDTHITSEMLTQRAKSIFSKIPLMKAPHHAYAFTQLFVALALIPLVAHPLDKLVQIALDLTYRPLVGLNKFEKADNWLGFRSVPNPKFWNKNPDTRMMAAMLPDMTLYEAPPTFRRLFRSRHHA